MMLTSLSPTLGVGARKHGRHRGSFVGFWPSIAVVSAVDPPLSRLASSLNRDVTVSGAAALNSRYGDGSISLHAALEVKFSEVRCSKHPIKRSGRHSTTALRASFRAQNAATT